MILFNSMSSVTICSIFTVCILLSFGTGRQPLVIGWEIVKSLLFSRKYLLFFVAVIAIMMLNKYELTLERWINIPYDLTPTLSGWEGTWPVWLQANFQSDLLTAFCAFFYLVVFQSVMIASAGIYTQQKNFKLYYGLCIAVLLNYILAVPFYLYVPVNEVWFVHPQVKFLMLDVFPTFEQEYRSLSGLNNCFPSLHTSISVTIALVASRSGNRRWAIFTWFNALVIIFSIFYLGIHWFTDMVAGIALSLFTVTVGLKIGEWVDRSSQVQLTADGQVTANAKLKTSRPIGS